MAENRDGGAAFPSAPWDNGAQHCTGERGMTLLDWFAGQALAGLAASAEHYEAAMAVSQANGVDCYGSFTAHIAYGMAADMLAERARRAEEGERRDG